MVVPHGRLQERPLPGKQRGDGQAAPSQPARGETSMAALFILAALAVVGVMLLRWLAWRREGAWRTLARAHGLQWHAPKPGLGPFGRFQACRSGGKTRRAPGARALSRSFARMRLTFQV